MHKDATAYVLSALTGFAACLAVTLVTGRREAWDSSLYFVAALPAMTIVSIPQVIAAVVAGRLAPRVGIARATPRGRFPLHRA